jgi:hypothetical protein
MRYDKVTRKGLYLIVGFHSGFENEDWRRKQGNLPSE